MDEKKNEHKANIGYAMGGLVFGYGLSEVLGWEWPATMKSMSIGSMGLLAYGLVTQNNRESIVETVQTDNGKQRTITIGKSTSTANQGWAKYIARGSVLRYVLPTAGILLFLMAVNNRENKKI